MKPVMKTVYEGRESQILHVFENIYFRLSSLELRHQCNIGIVELAQSIALIDYTVQEPDEELLEEAENLLKKPVRYIFFTHPHRDHADGLYTLHRKDISIIAPAACIEELRKVYGALPTVLATPAEAMDLDLEGMRFRLEFPPGAAHSPWDMFIGVPKLACVFTGDALVSEKYMYFQSSSIGGWIEFLRQLKKDPWEYFLLGHGAPAQKDYLDNAIRHLEALAHLKTLLLPQSPEIAAGLVGLRSGSAEFKTIVKRRLIDGKVPLSPKITKRLQELAETVGMDATVRQVGQLALRTVEGY
ncbi:hypothetical protein FACS1894187_09480 [Synergistales bacterium]|nr:hypothetical protein FACS1894187_09480 [Synergistales bacterium]